MLMKKLKQKIKDELYGARKEGNGERSENMK